MLNDPSMAKRLHNPVPAKMPLVHLAPRSQTMATEGDTIPVSEPPLTRIGLLSGRKPLLRLPSPEVTKPEWLVVSM